MLGNQNPAASYSGRLVLKGGLIALKRSSGNKAFIPWEAESSELSNVTRRRGNMEEATIVSSQVQVC